MERIKTEVMLAMIRKYGEEKAVEMAMMYKEYFADLDIRLVNVEVKNEKVA